MRGKGQRRGVGLLPLRRKYWKVEGLHSISHTRTCTSTLSLSLLSPVTALAATAILEAGDLGKRQRVEA